MTFFLLSFDEMVAYVEDGDGASCGASTINSPNTGAQYGPSVDAGSTTQSSTRL